MKRASALSRAFSAAFVAGVVAACSSASSTAPSSQSAATTPTATASPEVSPTTGSGVSPTPTASVTATPAAESGDAPAATLTYQDSNGDSLTQKYYFGAPETGTQLSDIAEAADGCAVGSPDDSAAIVVPMTVTTTLNSSVGTNAGLAFSWPGTLDPPTAIPGEESLATIFVYNLTTGYTCANQISTEAGTELDLSQGVPVSISAWVVLEEVISPDYPDGNPALLGTTGFQVSLNPGFGSPGGTLGASGPAVCTGGIANFGEGEDAFFLHFAGPVYRWEDCGANVSGPY
jgi:hypothetical protein